MVWSLELDVDVNVKYLTTHFRRTRRTLEQLPYVISAAGKTEIRTARCTASIWRPHNPATAVALVCLPFVRLTLHNAAEQTLVHLHGFLLPFFFGGHWQLKTQRPCPNELRFVLPPGVLDFLKIRSWKSERQHPIS